MEIPERPKDQTEKLKSLENELNEKKAKIENLEKEVDNLKNNISKKDIYLEQLKQEKQGLQDSNTTLISKNDKLRNENIGLSAEVLKSSSFKATAEELNNKADDLNNKIANLNGQITNLNKQIEDLNCQLDKERNHHHIWMPWVITTTILMLLETLKFGLSAVGVALYGWYGATIISFVTECALLTLLITVSVVHYANNEYFKTHSSKWFWWPFGILMTLSAIFTSLIIIINA